MMIIVNDKVGFMTERDRGMSQHIQHDVYNKLYK